MDATKKQIDENLDIQGSLMEAIKADYHKMVNGNKSSVARMRKAQMGLARLAKETRQLLTDYKASM